MTKICAVICDDTSLVAAVVKHCTTLLAGSFAPRESRLSVEKRTAASKMRYLKLVTNASATDDAEISILPTRKCSDAQLYEDAFHARLNC
jgi:hypothetical protein